MSATSRITLDDKCRQLVMNVVEFMNLEKENLEPIVPLTSHIKRAAMALKISEKTVRGIISESEETKATPSFKRDKKKLKTTDLPISQKIEIRNSVYTMYRENIPITLQSLQTFLKDRFIFEGSTFSLRRILTSLGFRYKKDCNRRILCEQSHVIHMRIEFLRSFHELQQQKLYNFVFLDETWIFAKGGNRRSWQDDSINSCRKRSCGEGKRYIVVHAGGEEGFVDGAGLIFASKKKTDDYHDNMTAELFQKWLREQLLPALSEPTVIILDNASYHSAVMEKCPTSGWKKAEITEWLQQKEVHIPEGASKNNLLQIVKNVKPEKQFIVEQLANEYGHKVLRLPPYHCHYNPIEHIWSMSKKYYDTNIGRVKQNCDETVINMWEESLNSVTAEHWLNSYNHCKKIIMEDWEKQICVEKQGDIIINLGEDSDSDENDICSNISESED